jgi:hypothetical protein
MAFWQVWLTSFSNPRNSRFHVWLTLLSSSVASKNRSVRLCDLRIGNITQSLNGSYDVYNIRGV